MAYSTIPKGSLYMDTKLYTGNNSPSNTISGIPFAPDLIWIKARGAATDHVLFDKVRGVYKSLSPNDSTAENNNTNQLQTFTSDGWTMGDLDTSNAATTFASWNWKANGAGSANTAGSINSTVSANTTAGFSIATFTTLGSTISTVGHGLGVIPDMVIVKTRANSNGWFVYHKDVGNNKFLRLETTGAETTNAMWNDTTPTSSVFSINANNLGASTSVAYCFADVQGFSKMGSYTGNGNNDGTFVYTGFSPSFVLYKDSTSVSDWVMKDNRRPGFNVTDDVLYPNLADAEGSGADIDFLSNGFKARTTAANTNKSNAGFIYMAFAENPFVATSGTSAIPVTAR
jgi:hypothetical protein